LFDIISNHNSQSRKMVGAEPLVTFGCEWFAATQLFPSESLASAIEFGIVRNLSVARSSRVRPIASSPQGIPVALNKKLTCNLGLKMVGLRVKSQSPPDLQMARPSS